MCVCVCVCVCACVCVCVETGYSGQNGQKLHGNYKINILRPKYGQAIFRGNPDGSPLMFLEIFKLFFESLIIILRKLFHAVIAFLNYTFYCITKSRWIFIITYTCFVWNKITYDIKNSTVENA